jgi:hypothetical protein
MRLIVIYKKLKIYLITQDNQIWLKLKMTTNNDNSIKGVLRTSEDCFLCNAHQTVYDYHDEKDFRLFEKGFCRSCEACLFCEEGKSTPEKLCEKCHCQTCGRPTRIYEDEPLSEFYLKGYEKYECAEKHRSEPLRIRGEAYSDDEEDEPLSESQIAEMMTHMNTHTNVVREYININFENCN